MIQPYTLELFEFVSRYWLAELYNQLFALAEETFQRALEKAKLRRITASDIFSNGIKNEEILIEWFGLPSVTGAVVIAAARPDQLILINSGSHVM